VKEAGAHATPTRDIEMQIGNRDIKRGIRRTIDGNRGTGIGTIEVGKSGCLDHLGERRGEIDLIRQADGDETCLITIPECQCFTSSSQPWKPIL
jgi:hypothetical protein